MAGKPGTLDEKDAQFIWDEVDTAIIRQHLFAEDVTIKHRNSKLNILIDAKLIRDQRQGSYSLLPGKA